MKEFINTLVQKADLNEEQATKVAEVLKGFLGDKLPEVVHGPVMAALSGENVDQGLDFAKGLLGKLL